jgi:hypothetical protein
LQTYRGGNRLREPSNGEVARVAFNGGGDDIWWRFGSNDFSGGGNVGLGSSSKCQIGTGGSGVATRQQRCGSAMAARDWAKFARDRALFRRVLAPNRRQQKS